MITVISNFRGHDGQFITGGKLVETPVLPYIPSGFLAASVCLCSRFSDPAISKLLGHPIESNTMNEREDRVGFIQGGEAMDGF